MDANEKLTRYEEAIDRYEAALERIIAHDDPEMSEAELSENDKNAGWYSAMRLCSDFARNALNPAKGDR